MPNGFSRSLLATLISLCVPTLAPLSVRAAERGVRQFLELAVSPDGARIASVEGDSSPAGGEPVVRALIIRTADGKSALTVALPCGQARECWPSSPVWDSHGKSLVFALRTPGTHARSLWSVAADGSHPTTLLGFNGTIGTLRFGPDGRLAMLAVAGARKEVGATQAGAPITGDLTGPMPEQRIAIFDRGQLRWASPPKLFVYQYDWLPDSSGFVGTAAPGSGDDNWWVAKLYRFRASDGAGSVIFTPPDIRHQIADPIVSKDGTVAFISGIMSDFGSTGGDVFTMPLHGGTAVDITPGMHASARGIAWGCNSRLHAEFLAGAATAFVEFPEATRPVAPNVLWRSEETFSGKDAGVSSGCPSAMTATVRQTFTAPPEIAIG
ncbi:MAG TPA: LpqB family beta-propeller domain-containing protein, partial [Rhizomicrobium sp.]